MREKEIRKLATRAERCVTLCRSLMNERDAAEAGDLSLLLVEREAYRLGLTDAVQALERARVALCQAKHRREALVWEQEQNGHARSGAPRS